MLKLYVMSTYDLASDAGLVSAVNDIGGPSYWSSTGQEWQKSLGETLAWFSSKDESERGTVEFQQKLWDKNSVAAVGQGNISIDGAIADGEFRRKVAAMSMEVLPESVEARLHFLTVQYESLKTLVEPFVSKTPHLKIFRVLAVMYPGAMTTVAKMGALTDLVKAMGGGRDLTTAGRHAWVRDRLDPLLGTTSKEPFALAERMVIPWFLYERFVQAAPSDRTERETAPAETELVPLPAARRRRGLTAIKGLFPSLLSSLEFIRDGVTRDELLDFLQNASPDSKTQSLGVTINSYKSEFGAIRLEGDRYLLTERGENTLESQDPSDLSDWLLTRILGVDNVIAKLREKSMTSSELVHLLQSVNPGWTSDYGPQAILGWLRSMGVVQFQGGMQDLTEVGRRWGARIHWEPESLHAELLSVEVYIPEVEENISELVLPQLEEILKSIQLKGQFRRFLVEELHSGLWADPIRHFAILSGLSGSGKTLLARSYAEALAGGRTKNQLLTLPVQPGWYDPGALLGYVNPLSGKSYARTRFLEFVLEAAADPRRPYIVVLDEMNLSHPEQYMAPLLSAMETGDYIQLHTEEEMFDGIPRAIRYPRNLVLIGTVNMDETTHGLSDKVLDRGFVHEFWEIDLKNYPKWGKRGMNQALEDQARTVLGALMDALSPAKLHFGWRVIDAVLDYLNRSEMDGSKASFADTLDSVIYAKVLPKLRGDDTKRFRAALENCEKALRKASLQRSCNKVSELLEDLEATGSARFWR